MITVTGANRKPVKQVKPSKLQNKKKNAAKVQVFKCRNCEISRERNLEFLRAKNRPLFLLQISVRRASRQRNWSSEGVSERERERVLQSEFLERGVFHRFFREKNNGEIHYPKWHFHYSLKPISGFFHRTPRNHRSSHRSHANRKQI